MLEIDKIMDRKVFLAVINARDRDEIIKGTKGGLVTRCSSDARCGEVVSLRNCKDFSASGQLTQSRAKPKAWNSSKKDSKRADSETEKLLPDYPVNGTF